MKKAVFIIMLIFSSVFVLGQTKVKASKIIRQINNGEKIHYKNVEITGNLHLYDLKNLEHHKGNTYHSYATKKIIFENCKFRGKVLGYYHDNYENETYAIQFEDDVKFINCIFRKEATFKYSEFNKSADFSGSKFHNGTSFKYALFREKANFLNVNFMDDIIFKYAVFDEKINFEKSIFEREANFKYTRFEDNVSFQNAQFDEDPIFKYARIKGRKAKNKLHRMTR